MAKKKKKSEKELREEILVSRLKELRKINVNEPTISYNVGDRVQYGHVKQTTITEVIDDGKIYRVHCVKINENYGNPFEYEEDYYFAWHEMEPYQSDSDIEKIDTITEKEDILINFSNRDVDGLLNTYYCFGVDLEPDYQRGNVWELEDKVKLIDSIFKNIDIGKFTIIRLPIRADGMLYEMLDGKQRLLALIDFKEGRFRYKGKLYRELHPSDRAHFDRYPIAWGDIRNLRSGKTLTDLQKYRYFIKLNTGGKQIDPAHIEKVKEMYESKKIGN